VVPEARYQPFGQERWSGGVAVTDFGFTGQRVEAGFGWLDYKAHYYDPGVGRFASADTLVPDYANPQALNHYAYVYNNPLRFMDPSGHANECGATARGDCEEGGTLVPGPTRDEWTEVERYAAGITYPDYVAGKAYYFDYASDPQLQFEDLKRINGFGVDSLDGAWRRRTYAKLYAEYALQQKLDIGTDFEVARAALAEARTSDDASYFFWGLTVFLAAVTGGSDGSDPLNNPLFEPGPYAHPNGWIPATGPKVTNAQRRAIQPLGNQYGCHTCGAKTPRPGGGGTWRADHQPPTKIAGGKPQRLYPQCEVCSNRQGGFLRWIRQR
jgi:RHS repeat-associated protein